MLYKYCGKCKKLKQISEFHKGKTLDGYDSYCKECRNKYAKNLYLKSKKYLQNKNNIV